MKLTKWKNSVVSDFRHFPKVEIFGETLRNFTNFDQNFAYAIRETGKFAHYEIMSFRFMFCKNIILMNEEKKDLQNDL